MTDHARYSEWNPFVVKLEPARGGALAVGTEIVLEVRWHSGGGTRTVEVVTRLEPPAPAASGGMRRATMEYRYLGWLPRLHLIRGSRVQTLEQASGGPTTYRTVEEFHGLLAGGVPLRRVQRG